MVALTPLGFSGHGTPPYSMYHPGLDVDSHPVLRVLTKWVFWVSCIPISLFWLVGGWRSWTTVRGTLFTGTSPSPASHTGPSQTPHTFGRGSIRISASDQPVTLFGEIPFVFHHDLPKLLTPRGLYWYCCGLTLGRVETCSNRGSGRHFLVVFLPIRVKVFVFCLKKSEMTGDVLQT